MDFDLEASGESSISLPEVRKPRFLCVQLEYPQELLAFLLRSMVIWGMNTVCREIELVPLQVTSGFCAVRKALARVGMMRLHLRSQKEGKLTEHAHQVLKQRHGVVFND